MAARETLTDSENAIFYKNEEDLLLKIVLFANDRILREKLGRNARELVKDYTWEKRETEILDIYDRRINGAQSKVIC